MDRLFCMLALSLCLMLAPVRGLQAESGSGGQSWAKPALFSMIFPQLIPPGWLTDEPAQESGARLL